MPTYAAYDGQVVFEVIGRNLKTILIEDDLRACLPDIRPGSQADILIDHLAQFLSRTKSITFGDVLPEDAEPLRTFWEFAQSGQSYEAIWNSFIEGLQFEHHNLWMAAINVPSPLAAPEAIRPGVNEDIDPKKNTPATNS